MSDIEFIEITESLLTAVKKAVESAIEYEISTGRKRKLGITGEVGEILTCNKLGLKLILDPRSAGYDAIDNNGRRIQIKTRRSESDSLPKWTGRVSRFSEHEFDYALLVILNPAYEIVEIWRAEYEKLHSFIEKQKRRDPQLDVFRRVGTRIFRT